MRPTTSTLLRLPTLPRIVFTLQLPRTLVAASSSALALTSELWRTPQLSLAGFGGALEEHKDVAQESECMQWDGMLNAVPKKKVSHSRKAMRAANKGLKDRVDLVRCAGCGAPKASHHICGICYGEISKAQKAWKNAVDAKREEALLARRSPS